MAITRQQMESLGFKKDKRRHFNMHHYALIYPLNKTDYLFSGYDKVTKKANFKMIWISRVLFEKERITEPLVHLGELSYTKLKAYIEDYKRLEEIKQNARDNQQD